MLTSRYGNIEDMVLEVRVVTGKGLAWQHSDRVNDQPKVSYNRSLASWENLVYGLVLRVAPVVLLQRVVSRGVDEKQRLGLRLCCDETKHVERGWTRAPRGHFMTACTAIFVSRKALAVQTRCLEFSSIQPLRTLEWRRFHLVGYTLLHPPRIETSFLMPLMATSR